MDYELTDKYADELLSLAECETDEERAIVLDVLYAQGMDDGSHEGYDVGYDEGCRQGYQDASEEGAGFTDAYDKGYDDGVKAYAPWKVLGAVTHKDYRPAYLAGFEAGWANEASQEAA